MVIGGRDQSVVHRVLAAAPLAACWPAPAPPAWRWSVQVVVIDMCTIHLAAARRVLPHARVAVGHFHVVQLGDNKVHEVRRRVTRDRYGRRGRAKDPGYAVKNLHCVRWAATRSDRRSHSVTGI